MMNTFKKICIRLYKMRNFWLLLLVVTLFTIGLSKLPRNYETTYEIDGYTVTEKYSTHEKRYYFTFKKGKNTFETFINHKYLPKKKLVTSINSKKTCLSYKSKINNDTICKNKSNEYVTTYFDKNINNNKTGTYKNIKLYELGNYKYYVWNYKSLLSITKTSQKKLKLFNQDHYNINLSTIYNKYLILPDYDEEHYFKKLYLINSKNDDIKETDLNKKIYFDSYFLGNYHKRVYLYDLHREKEFAIDPIKGKVDKVEYGIYKNNKYEKTTAVKLNKKNLYFENTDESKYIIKDEKLYYRTPSSDTLVSNLNVSKLIASIKDDAFFVSKDTLYHVNITEGINKVMSYSEWNFNEPYIYVFTK